MPDHIHLLVHVLERLPRHLGLYIAEFKSHVTNEWRKHEKDESKTVFKSGYHDRIILPEHKLDDVYQYIRTNPYRLAVRQNRPEFFQKIREHFIGARGVQLYGNLFLLRNPFKHALIVHRADDEATFQKKLDECLYYAMNGGIIVSAFISKREKEIRKEIEAAGGRIILIHDRPFAKKEKPPRHDFNLCSEGRLLMISPTDYLAQPKSEHPSRRQCLDMNTLAQTLTTCQ